MLDLSGKVLSHSLNHMPKPTLKEMVAIIDIRIKHNHMQKPRIMEVQCQSYECEN